MSLLGKLWQLDSDQLICKITLRIARPLRPRKSIGSALATNTLGVPWVSGGCVRAWIYCIDGLHQHVQFYFLHST